jgi:hypothetical protein
MHIKEFNKLLKRNNRMKNKLLSLKSQIKNDELYDFVQMLYVLNMFEALMIKLKHDKKLTNLSNSTEPLLSIRKTLKIIEEI